MWHIFNVKIPNRKYHATAIPASNSKESSNAVRLRWFAMEETCIILQYVFIKKILKTSPYNPLHGYAFRNNLKKKNTRTPMKISQKPPKKIKQTLLLWIPFQDADVLNILSFLITQMDFPTQPGQW